MCWQIHVQPYNYGLWALLSPGCSKVMYIRRHVAMETSLGQQLPLRCCNSPKSMRVNWHSRQALKQKSPFSHVNHRFHTIYIRWNLGLTLQFRHLSEHCRYAGECPTLNPTLYCIRSVKYGLEVVVSLRQLGISIHISEFVQVRFYFWIDVIVAKHSLSDYKVWIDWTLAVQKTNGACTPVGCILDCVLNTC